MTEPEILAYAKNREMYLKAYEGMKIKMSNELKTHSSVITNIYRWRTSDLDDNEDLFAMGDIPNEKPAYTLKCFNVEEGKKFVMEQLKPHIIEESDHIYFSMSEENLKKLLFEIVSALHLTEVNLYTPVRKGSDKEDLRDMAIYDALWINPQKNNCSECQAISLLSSEQLEELKRHYPQVKSTNA